LGALVAGDRPQAADAQTTASGAARFKQKRRQWATSGGMPRGSADSDDRDLHQQVRVGEATDLDRSARRQGAEVLQADVDVLEELLDVRHVGIGLDDVGQRRARRLESRLLRRDGGLGADQST